MLNLAMVLENNVSEQPGKTAIVFGDTRLTFAQLGGAVNQIAGGLADLGIGKGDKVALSCPNLPFFPMAYYAILKTGATVVPLNVLLKGREIAYHLQDSEAAAYLCFQGTPELPMAQEGYKGFTDTDSCEHFFVITADPAAASPIEGTKTLGQLMAGRAPVFDLADTAPEDGAVILYTSGTTGFPKGAELSHSNMMMNALASRDLLELSREDVHVLVLPLFHSFGQTMQMNAGFAKGNTLVLIARFDPEAVLNAFQSERATVFAGVPTMYWALLTYEDKEGKFDLEKIAANLRCGVSGGASMPLEILKGIEKKYRIPIIEGYGLSETSPVATFNHLYKERKPGSIGTSI